MCGEDEWENTVWPGQRKMEVVLVGTIATGGFCWCYVARLPLLLSGKGRGGNIEDTDGTTAEVLTLQVIYLSDKAYCVLLSLRVKR